MRKLREEMVWNGKRNVKHFLVLCEKHNQTNLVYSSSFLKGYSGCKECGRTNRSIAHREDPAIAIKECGQLGWGTTGLYEMRKSGNRQRLHVEVYCPHHPVPQFKSMNNIRNGSAECSICSAKTPPDTFYLLSIKKGDVSAIKFGITGRLLYRISDLERTSGFEVRPIYIFKGGITDVVEIERCIRDKFGGGYLPKGCFGSGYTETLPDKDLGKVLDYLGDM